MIQSKHSDDTIASESFSPVIGEEYKSAYVELLTKISNALSINREQILLDEITRIEKLHNEKDKDLDTLRYLATLNVLIDLSKQGWVFDIHEDKLILRMDNDQVDDKARIRYRLSAERNAQFKVKSVQAFIWSMEKTKIYNGHQVSIKDLIGDPDFLRLKIKGKEKVVDPYIQLVTNARDEFTGYKFSDIWRYFRYTWSIPYKTMPGRNLFYLVRDRLQPFHPVIGIFALGNSVLNLSVRDNDIGWTVDAIKEQIKRKKETSYCEQSVGGTPNGKVKVKICVPIETESEYQLRANEYADKMYPLLIKNIDTAIKDIYVRDLNYHRQTKYPRQETIDELLAIAEESGKKAINNHNNEKNPDWREEAESNLFRRKRASELAKLLSAKRVFQHANGTTNLEKLNDLLSSETGRRAINTALIANRKCKIGSNMMEIIVCGAIPPYNELLCGKLVSMLACSPVVIRDYTLKYENQISEIASRMKGEAVVRDSRLAFLGTTSLYSVGSSQYNRINVPFHDGSSLRYKKMGITEGYGTVYFSTETTTLFSDILQKIDGGKRINHVFGEGTSPRFRMISRGLSAIGIRADAFLRHYSPRIVYSMELAKNTKDFLLGLTDELDYGFDLKDNSQVETRTAEIVDFWYARWLEKRLTTVDIDERLAKFNVEEFLLSKML